MKLKVVLTLGAFLFLLMGCAHNVLVHHYSVPNKLAPEEAYRTSRIYLLSHVPPLDDTEKSNFEKALDLVGSFLPSKTKERYDRPLKRSELESIAKKAAEIIHRTGNRVISYQVAYSTQNADWTQEFSPTSSLWLTPSDFIVKQETQEYTVKTDQGEKKTKKYKLSINFSMGWALRKEPEKTLLVKGKFPGYGAILEEEKMVEETDLEEYLKSKFSTLIANCFKKMEEEILPHEVEKWRSISKAKGEMETAYIHVQNNELDPASMIWKSILQKESSNWEAHYNLGVYYETKSEWSQARASYQTALVNAPESKRKKISKILEELGQLTAPANNSQEKVLSFYDKKLAILPLANESIDLRGVDYMRFKLNEVLTQKGYQLISIPEIDEKLKSKGILEGGQLNLLTPKECAQHLGADRVLYGTIEEFRVMNVGIFYKRQVRLALKLYNKEGQLLWKNTGQTIVQSGIRPQEAAQSFLFNLAATQIEKVTKTYLKEESDETVNRALETLPQKLLRVQFH